MTIVFTLCSANYLAHAKTLGDSLREHNPDFHFVIGLVDRWPKELAVSYGEPYEVIPVEELGLPQFPDMMKKYNVIELNTAVKPFYLAFLFERNPNVEAVIYLDPDILVCGSFATLLEKLRQYNIVVTPHSCTYDDSAFNIHYEKVMLWAGVFNLGFIGVSRTGETFKFLKWWQIRLQDHCFRKPSIPGSFYDQIWMGLAPLYFRGIYIEKDPGYNLCYWNHFERRLVFRGGRYVVNDKHDLIFIHFSGYKPENPDASVSRPTEPIATFVERPDLRPIYDDYRSRLLARNYASIKPLPWYFARPEELAGKRKLKKIIKGFVKQSVSLLPVSARTRLKRLAQFTAENCGLFV
jgi:lipopolysaccharide biosynthesis glycosyltransferase